MKQSSEKEFLTNDRGRSTVPKCVALVSVNATTNGTVINDSTVCVRAAGSRARVYASLIDTGAIRWTVRADNTLRTTVRCRADHVGQATTLSLPRNDRALRVGSTGMRAARVRW